MIMDGFDPGMADVRAQVDEGEVLRIIDTQVFDGLRLSLSDGTLLAVVKHHQLMVVLGKLGDHILYVLTNLAGVPLTPWFLGCLAHGISWCVSVL